MSDRETKVLGFIAVASGKINLFCDGDSCIVMCSEEAMRRYIKKSTVNPDIKMDIRKARYGHVLTAMKLGAPYSFDREAFARFRSIAQEDGLDITDFTPEGQKKPEGDDWTLLMRVQLATPMEKNLKNK